MPLALILFFVISRGAQALNLEFFTTMPKPVGAPGGGMLNAIVGIIEFRADAADFRAHRVTDHLLEPVAVDDFEIVIEEADHRSVSLADAKIIDRGKVEVAGEMHHSHSGLRR